MATDKRKTFQIEDLVHELDAREIKARLNLITNGIDITGCTGESQEHILDTLPTILYSDLVLKYKSINEKRISDYLYTIASRNTYNPALDLLRGVKWDRKDHLKDVYAYLGIPKDDELSRLLILKWFWQGLALLHNSYERPFGADGLLLLVGEQGHGKTSFFAHIAMDSMLFGEGESISSFDKDCERRCLCHWISELGEIDHTFRKADLGKLKSFITNAFDSYRLPYGRTDENHPRRANLCATVNGDSFLVDSTGNRRFWSVPVAINQDQRAKLLEQIDAAQVWKQVWEQYARNNLQGFRLTPREREDLEVRNCGHVKAIAAEDEIREILSSLEGHPLQKMTATEFKNRHLDLLSRYDARQIGLVLQRLGYDQYKSGASRKYMLPVQLSASIIEYDQKKQESMNRVK